MKEKPDGITQSANGGSVQRMVRPLFYSPVERYLSNKRETREEALQALRESGWPNSFRQLREATKHFQLVYRSLRLAVILAGICVRTHAKVTILDCLAFLCPSASLCRLGYGVYSCALRSNDPSSPTRTTGHNE